MHKPVQEMRMNMAKVVYWSQTGNTQTMAEAVAKGITAAGGSAECVAVSDITPQDLAGEAVFALGCPAMGAEVLEESEMEPFVEELEKSVSGKKNSVYSVLMDGAMANGCATGLHVWKKLVLRSTAAKMRSA